jgi:hypothetical protein
MRRASLAAVVFAVLAAACAGNPEPGDDGYAYNVNGEYTAEFITDDDGTAIYGTITLATAKGGIVTGKMALTNPFTVDGDVEGLLFEDELTLTVWSPTGALRLSGTWTSPTSAGDLPAPPSR